SMPVAHINVLQGHSKDVLKRVIRDVSTVMVEVLAAPKDRLEIWVTEIDPDLWGIAGEPASEVLKTRPRGQVEMPYIEMVLMEGRSLAQHHQLIVAVTDAIEKNLGTERNRIRVHIANCTPDHWGIGGIPAAISRKAEIEARKIEVGGA
ncbi:MAG: tautomerase family protein, partial [Rugosibacter sp.]